MTREVLMCHAFVLGSRSWWLVRAGNRIVLESIFQQVRTSLFLFLGLGTERVSLERALSSGTDGYLGGWSGLAIACSWSRSSSRLGGFLKTEPDPGRS